MKIVWTPQAIDSYIDNVDFVRLYWGEKVVDSFVSKVESVIEIISVMPYAYPAPGEDKKVRKCVLIEPISLYYRVKLEHIELITFWDNRKNPDRLRL